MSTTFDTKTFKTIEEAKKEIRHMLSPTHLYHDIDTIAYENTAFDKVNNVWYFNNTETGFYESVKQHQQYSTLFDAKMSQIAGAYKTATRPFGAEIAHMTHKAATQVCTATTIMLEREYGSLDQKENTQNALTLMSIIVASLDHKIIEHMEEEINQTLSKMPWKTSQKTMNDIATALRNTSMQLAKNATLWTI